MWKFGIILSMTFITGARADAPLPLSRPSVAPAKKKERPVREKENEGTEALNRFEADTVIKSKYQRNGQPMEVDPD